MDLSTALSSLVRAKAALAQTASRLARITTPDAGPVDIVDLSTAMLDLLAARQEFGVNVKVIQTADQIEQHALDILA